MDNSCQILQPPDNRHYMRCIICISALLLCGLAAGCTALGYAMYAMPKPDILTGAKLYEHCVPSPTNLLGAKGAGEAGTTGAIPTLANAVIDALRPLGIHQLDFPYSPARIWSAIHGRR